MMGKFVACLLAASLLAACATDPYTGERRVSLSVITIEENTGERFRFTEPFLADRNCLKLQLTKIYLAESID